MRAGGSITCLHSQPRHPGWIGGSHRLQAGTSEQLQECRSALLDRGEIPERKVDVAVLAPQGHEELPKLAQYSRHGRKSSVHRMNQNYNSLKASTASGIAQSWRVSSSSQTMATNGGRPRWAHRCPLFASPGARRATSGTPRPRGV